MNGVVQQAQRLGPGGLRLLDQASQALLRTCASSSVCMDLLPAAAAAWLAAQLTQEFEAKQPSLADQIPGYGGGYGPKPGPSHTGNDKPANPTPGGSSTEYPAEGPKESGVVGGKPLDPQKPEGSILPGKPAEPLPGIGPVFNKIPLSILGNDGKLPPGIGGPGTPIPMPPSTNPNDVAEKFARDAFNGQIPTTIIKDLSGAGSWLAKLPDGTVVLYRPAGTASYRTDTNTATVEVNNSEILAINRGEQAKFKFPKK